jgi:citrate synthase
LTRLSRGNHRRTTASTRISTIVAAYDRIRADQDIVAPREDLGHAANFLYMLNGEEPDDVLAETFDMPLVLLADNGLDASTFSSVVTASTPVCVHSAGASAIEMLSGSLHHGANPNVYEQLLDLGESRS